MHGKPYRSNSILRSFRYHTLHYTGDDFKQDAESRSVRWSIITHVNIREGESGQYRGDTVFTLVDGARELGNLHFRPRRLFCPAELTFVGTPYHSRQGYGKVLVQAFVDKVGPGRVVTSEIVHTPTWDALERLDFLRVAFERGACAVTDHDTLANRIPITRFLERGGIHILKFDIAYGTREKKRLPTYGAIVALHRELSDHYINFFRTKIIGNIE